MAIQLCHRLRANQRVVLDEVWQLANSSNARKQATDTKTGCLLRHERYRGPVCVFAVSGQAKSASQAAYRRPDEWLENLTVLNREIRYILFSQVNVALHQQIDWEAKLLGESLRCRSRRARDWHETSQTRASGNDVVEPYDSVASRRVNESVGPKSLGVVTGLDRIETGKHDGRPRQRSLIYLGYNLAYGALDLFDLPTLHGSRR
jgi:hypothetical protein